MSSPLLETTIDGAHSIIINFTGGHDMKIKEINEAASQVREAVSPDADIIFGAVVDENMQDDLIITIIASRFEQDAFQGRSSKLGQAQMPLSSFNVPPRGTQSAQRSTIDDLPDFLRPQRGSAPSMRGRSDAQATGFSRSSSRQTDREMIDMIQRASEHAARQDAAAPRVLDEAPAVDSRQTKSRQSRQDGRTLPWFLQDEDDDRA
jgi:cell division protein FtsZ